MKELRTDFQQLFAAHADDFLHNLDGLLQIPSVSGHATFEAPFWNRP